MDLFKKVEWFEKLALELASKTEGTVTTTESEYSEERIESLAAIQNRKNRLAQLTKKK